MTKEEYKKIVEKGRRWLIEYLSEEDEGILTPEHRRQIFGIISDEYKRLMHDDEDFYRAVEDFCSERRFKSEKRAFLKKMVTKMVSSGVVRMEHARRYPQEYTLK